MHGHDTGSPLLRYPVTTIRKSSTRRLHASLWFFSNPAVIDMHPALSQRACIPALAADWTQTKKSQRGGFYPRHASRLDSTNFHSTPRRMPRLLTRRLPHLSASRCMQHDVEGLRHGPSPAQPSQPSPSPCCRTGATSPLPSERDAPMHTRDGTLTFFSSFSSLGVYFLVSTLSVDLSFFTQAFFSSFLSCTRKAPYLFSFTFFFYTLYLAIDLRYHWRKAKCHSLFSLS